MNCEIILQYSCEDTLDPQVDSFWPSTPNKDGVTLFLLQVHDRTLTDLVRWTRRAGETHNSMRASLLVLTQPALLFACRHPVSDFGPTHSCRTR